MHPSTAISYAEGGPSPSRRERHTSRTVFAGQCEFYLGLKNLAGQRQQEDMTYASHLLLSSTASSMLSAIS